MFWKPSRVSVSVSQVYCKITVLSIFVSVHVMSKSIVYISVILQEFSLDMPILCISGNLLSILAITTRMSCLIADQTVLIVEFCLYRWINLDYIIIIHIITFGAALLMQPRQKKYTEKFWQMSVWQPTSALASHTKNRVPHKKIRDGCWTLWTLSDMFVVHNYDLSVCSKWQHGILAEVSHCFGNLLAP